MPDPDARRSAVVKLGNSQRLQYIPALQARLNLEKDPAVRKALADEHGQNVMGLAQDLAGTHGLLAARGPFGVRLLLPPPPGALPAGVRCKASFS